MVLAPQSRRSPAQLRVGIGTSANLGFSGEMVSWQRCSLYLYYRHDIDRVNLGNGLYEGNGAATD